MITLFNFLYFEKVVPSAQQGRFSVILSQFFNHVSPSLRNWQRNSSPSPNGKRDFTATSTSAHFSDSWNSVSRRRNLILILMHYSLCISWCSSLSVLKRHFDKLATEDTCRIPCDCLEMYTTDIDNLWMSIMIIRKHYLIFFILRRSYPLHDRAVFLSFSRSSTMLVSSFL